MDKVVHLVIALTFKIRKGRDRVNGRKMVVGFKPFVNHMKGLPSCQRTIVVDCNQILSLTFTSKTCGDRFDKSGCK